MNKGKIFNYILNTPQNINVNILSQMMDEWAQRPSDQQFIDSIGLTKLNDYLYSAQYTSYDYEQADKYFKKFKPQFGVCSAFIGNWVGDTDKILCRNFDWFYNENVEFIIRVPKTTNRHASIGIATNMPQLTKSFVQSKQYDVAYRILPYMTVDGINDAHVACEINVVPAGDKGRTTGTNPGKPDLYGVAVVRFILDNADSALDGIKKLSERNIFSEFGDMQEQFHFMIADLNATYQVEFIDNQIHIISSQNDEYDNFPNNLPIVTNFYLSDWDGTLATASFNSENFDADTTTLTPHAAGVERYKIIMDGLNNDALLLDQILQVCQYTNSYKATTNPYWYSQLNGEIQGYGDFTIYDQAEKYSQIKQIYIQMFEDRQRNGLTWHTMHSVIYNLNYASVQIIVQQDDDHPYDAQLFFAE